MCSNTIIHPGYVFNGTHILNDLALLQLSQFLSWSQTVSPICMPSMCSTEDYAGDVGTIAGWGLGESTVYAYFANSGRIHLFIA